jgi:hypothetical protein
VYFIYLQMNILLLFYVVLIEFGYAYGVNMGLQEHGAQIAIEIEYPLHHLVPVVGTSFSTVVTPNSLTCFGNRDYIEPAYRQTFMCMLPLPSIVSNFVECDNVWGSRGVVVTVKGSVEFLQVNHLPTEDKNSGQLQATRWLELQSVSSETEQREVKYIPAEPFYLCARSIDWAGNDSSFKLDFRPVYLRESDRFFCTRKLVMHVVFLLAVSSLWLLPYIAAFVTCVVTYTLGLHRFGLALAFSSIFVCLAPLMLTQKNRHQARLYIAYFFGPQQAYETREAVRKRLPLFQAMFFSCALMCTGSAGSYIIYSYFGVDRETRNNLIKLTMGVSAGWFIFVLCRFFEVFFNQWSWLVLTVFLLQYLFPHINPSCKEEAALTVLLITFLTKRLVVPHLPRNLRRVSQLLGMQSALNVRKEISAAGASDSQDEEKIADINELSESSGLEADGETKTINITVNVTIEAGSSKAAIARDVQTAVLKAVKTYETGN